MTVIMSLTDEMYRELNNTVNKTINGVKITGYIPDSLYPKLVGEKDNQSVIIACRFIDGNLIMSE